jgi:hypothetical protein
MKDPTNHTLADWSDDITENEAQLAAGDLVPGGPVVQRLRESIAELEAKLGGGTLRGIVPH